MRHHVRNLALLVFTSLSVLGGSARADFISFTHTTAQTPTPFIDTFAINGFDTSLGTLTSVTLTQTVTLDATLAVFNNSTTPYTFTNATAQETATLITAAGVMVPVTATAVVASGTANPGFNFFNPTGSMTTNYNVLTSNLSRYETGPVPVSLTVNFGGAMYSGQTGTTPGNTLFFGGSASAGGTTTITYDYTPNATSVPEPASLSLVACGLAGVGLVARRRRTA